MNAADAEALVRLLREELLKTQLIVLDLNDRVLEKETEQADAVAVLGKLELVLEEKLNSLAALQTAHAKQIEERERDLRVRDMETRELTAKLASSSEEISRLHKLLDEQKRAHDGAQQTLAATTTQLDVTRAQLAEAETALAKVRRQLTQVLNSGWWKLGRPWRALFGPKP
jgi:hypothetical protein